MFSPWFFWQFSSWQGQLPYTPSTLFLSWSKSFSLLYISLVLSWDGFISHCFILSSAPIFTYKVNVYIDKSTAFLWVTPVIRKEIIQICHIIFLRCTHDLWEYFMYVYPLLSPKGFRAASSKIKPIPSLESRRVYVASICEKKVPILILVRHPPIFILREQWIFNLKMFLKLCVSKLVQKNDLYLNSHYIFENFHMQTLSKQDRKKKKQYSRETPTEGRDRVTATERASCLGLSGVLDHQDCLNSGCLLC